MYLCGGKSKPERFFSKRRSSECLQLEDFDFGRSRYSEGFPLLQSCDSIWLSWTLRQLNTIEDSHTADAIALHIGTSWKARIINKEITLRIEEIFRWNFWLLQRSHLVMLHKPLCVLVGRLSLSKYTDKDKLITHLKNVGLDLWGSFEYRSINNR